MTKASQPYGVADQSRVRLRPLIKWWAVATAGFLLFLLTIFLIGALPPEPNLPSPYSTVEWQQVKAEQVDELTTYRMLDAETGRVQIPIERAKELLIEQGLPTRE